jgi:hypothetical protein
MLRFQHSALAPLRERFSHLFSSSSYNLRRFVWQHDTVGVVNFVYEGFQVRTAIRTRGIGGLASM